MEYKNENIALRLRSILNITDAELGLYLKLIDAPIDGRGILNVTGRFLKIYPIIENICSIESVDEFINSVELSTCLHVASEISSHEEALLKSAPGSRYPQNMKSRPFDGIYLFNPIYVCLGVSDFSNHGSSRHLILEAYLLVVTFILRGRQSVRPDSKKAIEYDAGMERGCRLARTFLLRPKLDSLKNLPDALFKGPGEYLEHLNNGGEELRPLFILIEYALAKKQAPTHEREGTRRNLRQVKHTINDAVDPELMGRVDRVELMQPEIKRANTHLDPIESSDGVEYLKADAPGKSPMEDDTSDHHKKNRRYYLHSIAMHNQRFMGRWDMLTLHEISIFLETIQLIAEKRHQLYNTEKLPTSLKAPELCAVAITIFLRSVPLSKDGLETLKLNDGAYDQISPPGYRYYPSKTGSWIAKTPTLGFSTKLDTPNFFAKAEKSRGFFYLSSGTGLENIIDTYIREVRGTDPIDKKLFLRDTDTYERALSSLCSYLNQKHKTRLTVKRIEWYLHNLLSRQKGGDLTTAMLLNGREDFLGVPPLHYTAVHVSRLQELYHECCTRVISDHQREMAARYPDTAPTSLPATSWFHSWNGTSGTTFRPRRRAVRDMVARLQERLEFMKQAPRSLEKLIRIHNNIVRYTAVLFAYSTGFRAVTSPILPPSQIDDTTGFAVISDKDGIDYYNARIVWLPPVCLKQYHMYLEHLDALFPKLEHLDLEAFNALKQLREMPIPSDRLPLFFMLTQSGKSTKITPTDLWKDIRNNLRFDLPGNASRHYLRSFLLEQGCPPEIIAAFMGHWSRGEEPWGSYSALSPTNYAATIGKYLIQLLEEDGWRPISGMRGHW